MIGPKKILGARLDIWPNLIDIFVPYSLLFHKTNGGENFRLNENIYIYIYIYIYIKNEKILSIITINVYF